MTICFVVVATGAAKHFFLCPANLANLARPSGVDVLLETVENQFLHGILIIKEDMGLRNVFNKVVSVLEKCA